MRNLSQLGPRKLKIPPAQPKVNGNGAAELDLKDIQAPAGRVFYLEDELVRDPRPWPMPGDEWVMNGKGDEKARPDPELRKSVLRRLMDPFLNEAEALAVLQVTRPQLREAVNRRRLTMYRSMTGERFFRLSEVLELALQMEGKKPAAT